MHRAGIDGAFRHRRVRRGGLFAQIFIWIGGELAAAAGRAEGVIAAVMGVVVRAPRRIDRHAAHRIDDAAAGVMRLNQSFHAEGLLATDTLEGYIADMRADAKTAVMKRLKRIEGQVRGLTRMVEDDRYCIDIITQLSAARAALRRAEEEILADHVAHCVEHAITSGNKTEQRRKVGELIEVLSRSNR